jgi:ADP-heptose:LPS heptosyltransferase
MKRILIVQLDNIGDNLLGLPLLYRLRNSYPNAKIDIVVQSRISDLYRSCPLVDRIIKVKIPTGRFERLIALIKNPLLEIIDRNVSYDIACCPRWSSGDGQWSARIIDGANAGRKIAFCNHTKPTTPYKNPRYPYGELIPDGISICHETDRYRQLATYLTCEALDNDLNLWIDNAGESESIEFMRSNKIDKTSGIIGYGIGATNGRRRWNDLKYIELISIINEKMPQTTSLLIGNGDNDEMLAKKIIRSLPDRKIISAVGRLSIHGVAAIMRHMCLHIGCDSGPGHLASSVGIPTITISCFPIGAESGSNFDIERFRPARHSVVLRPTNVDMQCKGKNGCIMNYPHCILTITARQVAERAFNIIGPIDI